MAFEAPFDFVTSKTSQTVDKGWSWVVMVGTFGALFIVIGYQRSFGLLYVAFEENYSYSSTELSSINSVNSLTFSFCSLFVMNILLKKISVRTSAMIGVTIQTVGLMACFFYTDMIALIIFLGFFYGVGYSMLYCPAMLILSQYFERYRAIATTAALCGVSTGGLVFPYITQLLLDNFGPRGTMIILAACLFQQNVFFALYRPIMRVNEEMSDNMESCMTVFENEEDKGGFKTDRNRETHKIVKSSFQETSLTGQQIPGKFIYINENANSNSNSTDNEDSSPNYGHNVITLLSSSPSTSIKQDGAMNLESVPGEVGRLYQSDSVLPGNSSPKHSLSSHSRETSSGDEDRLTPHGYSSLPAVVDLCHQRRKVEAFGDSQSQSNTQDHSHHVGRDALDFLM